MTENEAIKGFEMDNMLLGASEEGVVERNNIAIQALEEIQQYRAIGTVEEFKTLKEKNEPEKPLGYKYSWDCPRCGTFHSINGKYCSECGQAVEFE